MKLPIDRAVEALSPSRDLALDVVRSWSLIIVVLGHFIMQVVYWYPNNTATTSNVLSSGNPWPYVTWLMQVMPLFFIAGGAVNYQSWTKHKESWATWVYHRFQRLMRPTLVFLLVMAIIFTIWLKECPCL